MRAISSLTLEYGAVSSVLRAPPALRRRVRKSAMGSESWLMVWLGCGYLSLFLRRALGLVGKGHPKLGEQGLRCFIGLGAGDDGHVKPDSALDLVEFHLGKN